VNKSQALPTPATYIGQRCVLKSLERDRMPKYRSAAPKLLYRSGTSRSH